MSRKLSSALICITPEVAVSVCLSFALFPQQEVKIHAAAIATETIPKNLPAFDVIHSILPVLDLPVCSENTVQKKERSHPVTQRSRYAFYKYRRKYHNIRHTDVKYYHEQPENVINFTHAAGLAFFIILFFHTTYFDIKNRTCLKKQKPCLN